MSILYREDSRQFHLTNGKISYIFCVLDNGELGHLYFGPAVRDRESFTHWVELARRDMALCCFADRPDFSMNHIRQEYPSFGHGDLHMPAYEIQRPNGSRITEFVYRGHRIYAGKPRLEGLPATYTESDEEACTLEIDLYDACCRTTLTILYTIFEDLPAIARSARFACEGGEGIRIGRALSLCLDLPDKNFEMVELAGAWARERSVVKRPLCYGLQGVYSRIGCSGPSFNPFLALTRPGTTESQGEVYGFSLVYSGNFMAQVEVDTFDVSRVTMGIHPDGFCWPLQPGQSFQTPEAVMVYSAEGLTGMSQVYHQLYRRRLARGVWRDRPRPILINNWEATYFDFDEEKLLRLARTAARAGIELFVLDDGWFGARTSDRAGLGDWVPNPERLPQGIGGLARKIRQLGLSFGLWIEPEMVNPDSDLYRAHPDWIISDPDHFACLSRNQYVLDFSRPEVVEHIYKQISAVLRESGAEYIKWDMNRCISECFSRALPAEQQGTLYHRQILGVYALYERLTREFSHILFESCSSGGARFDPGMLYYAPQTWTSDNTDAMQRVEIQYGTSFVYPLSSIGAHVSASPNHQLGRCSSLSARAHVAMFGTFGYELDLGRLSEAELEEISAQTAWMKEHRELLQFGRFYRLCSPFEEEAAAWMVVSEDKTRAIVGWYRFRQPAHGRFTRIRLRGLDPNLDYTVAPANRVMGGDELMQIGLSTSDPAQEPRGDGKTRLYLLQAVPRPAEK